MSDLRRVAKLAAMLILALALVLVAGCATKPLAQASVKEAAEEPVAEPVQAPADWTLQFTDNFERKDLGKDWKVLEGDWFIANGMVDGQGTIVCTRKLTGAHRLEFDAKSNDPCDLTAIICADERGYRGGYFFGFGSDDNDCSKLLVKGKEVKRWDTLITPGKLHHVVCQRDGKKLTHIVDGKVVMAYIHEEPLKGEGHQMIGFYIYSSGKIDNVKIYTKPGE